MRAMDVMTTNVATLSPDATIRDAAALFMSRNISGAPVVGDDGKVVGVLSEGDLLHRAELGTAKRRSWWLKLFDSPDQEASNFVRSHATRVADLMSRPAVTVTEDTQLAEVADILERRRIRRVPVLRDGKLVGIVSRADLVRGLVAAAGNPDAVVSVDDETIRARILRELETQNWAAGVNINVIVKDGIVHIWGMVHSDAEKRALRTAAEGTPGVRRVDDRLAYLPASFGAA